jgi:MFS transporter, DHA1 family, inner membrane transport protein
MNFFTHRPRAAADGLLAAAMLSFLATAGFFYVNIMPALVEGLRAGLQFSEREAGLVGSANVYGAAFGALLATFLVTRWAWRPAAYALLAVLMSIDLASILVATAPLMTAVRAVHGLAGGCLVGISYGVFARTRKPERTFGMLLVVQGGLGGLGVMGLPKLVPLFGTQSLFLALVGVSLAALLMLPFLAEYPAVPPPPEGAAPTAMEREAAARVPAGRLPLMLALVSVFLFQFANMLLFTYIIGLARHFGLDSGGAENIVGVATWIGMLGAALVVAFGTRFGRVRTLMVSLLLTAAGMYLLHGSACVLVYSLANIGTGITWSFVIPHLLGMCARCDLTGRAAAMGGFASKLGLATGPLVGALLLGSDRYAALIDVATVGIFICAAATLIPAARLDRLDARALPAALDRDATLPQRGGE